MKTGYTRGATTREIYQNRVMRNNRVLIPWEVWDLCKMPDDGREAYENDYIVLVKPSWYFGEQDADLLLAAQGLELGINALLLYKLRADWESFRPKNGKLTNGKEFRSASARTKPLGGVYLARIHATVSNEGPQVTEGFNSNTTRGAGIRVYEYASKSTINEAKLQLEALMWMCHDVDEQMIKAGMTQPDLAIRKSAQLNSADRDGLLDLDRLRTLRMIDNSNRTTCPLCIGPISAAEFLRRTEQAEGRETYDLTTTEVSLFHVQELRVGKFQHKPYNLGWGHNHCNVVVKDFGIMPTLKWMKWVLDNQPTLSFEEETRLVEEAVEG